MISLDIYEIDIFKDIIIIIQTKYQIYQKII